MSNLKFCERPESVYVGENTTVRDVMAELEALRADAERYRWLREQHNDGDDQWFVYGAQTPADLDRDIDEARKGAA